MLNFELDKKQNKNKMNDHDRDKKIAQYFATKAEKKSVGFWFSEKLEEFSQNRQIKKMKTSFTKRKIQTIESKSNLFKRYLKKMLSFNNKAPLARKAAALLTVLVVLFGTYFANSPKSLGATYTFVQTDWSGGLDGGTYPDHDNNRTGWTAYDSKDASIATGTELTLTQNSGSVTHDDDTDFSTGTDSNTETTGTGTSAVVGITYETAVATADVSMGENTSCTVSEYGYVYCAGAGDMGQLGNGTNTSKQSTPVQVLKGAAADGDNDGIYLSNIKSVSAGGYHTCAVSNAGNVYCWGYNARGGLGNGNYTSQNLPVRVIKGAADAADNDGTYLNNIGSIYAEKYHTCAIADSGNTYCWGQGTYGQLGNNSDNTNNSAPVRVLKGEAVAADNDGTYLNNIKKFSIGDDNTCAVSNSGNAYCWGRSLDGVLGDNNNSTDRWTPIRVYAGASDAVDNDGTYLNNIKDITTGAYYSCATANSGYVYCWGANSQGQLGDGTNTLSLVPVRVLKGAANSADNDGTYLDNINNLVNMAYTTCSISGSGYVYCWGYGTYGALGDGTGGGSYTPKQVLKGEAVAADNDGTYLSNIKNIANSWISGCAISNENNVYCWGKNGYGESADSTLDYRLSPVRMHGVGNVGYLDLSVHYNSSGTFTNIMDTGQISDFTTLSFAKTTPASTTLTIDARAGNTATPDGTWTAWSEDISSGGSIASLSDNRYIQYRANLATSDTDVIPTLDDITVNYTYYTAGTLTSSAYDSGSDSNILSGITWSETLNNGDVKFQVRTAPDSSGSPGSWTAWQGPGGEGTYFTAPDGSGEDIPAALSDLTNDQWVQFKTYLTPATSTCDTPTLSDVTMTYVVNAPPNFDATYGTNGITISQVSDSEDANWGKVKIDYAIRDVDTTSGTFTADYVTPSFEYSLNGGSTWADVGSSSIAFGSAPSGGEIIDDNDDGDMDNKVLADSYLTYTAYWDAKTDADENYVNNLKIRVTLDDNEAANATVTATSANADLDTKDPTGLSLVVDHTTNQLTMATPTDDSSYQMAVSNLSSFSGASYGSFSSPYTYGSMTADPATVYLRIRDAYGNYTDTSATTPDKPDNLTYYDVTDTEKGDFRELIAWGAISSEESGAGFSSYQIYRSTDGSSYSLNGTRTDRLVNYYIDASVEEDETYYYKLFAEDINGNKSAFSEVISDTVDGQGSSDSTPPTLSSVAVSSIQTTSAVVTWTTNEVSDSSVGYSTDATYLPELGSTAMGTSHEITLTGLTPGTTYNVRVKSRDVSNNLGQNDKDNPGSTPIGNFTFDTLPGPAISAVTVPSISNTQATIQWQTTTNSSTYVVYSDEVSEGALVDPIEIGTPDLVGGSAPFDHSQEITELTENTRYYFYVKSVDGTSNVAIDNNGGEFYELLTTQDDNSPVVSSVEASIVSDTEAAIHWVTDEQATSQVKYSTTSGGPYTNTTEVSILSRSHYVILTGLTSNTTYYYKVISSDINENETMSAEYNFTTLKNPEYQHDPLSEITDVTESIITDAKAVITFDTDQPAQCSVEYGTESENYTEVPISENDYNEEHAVHLSGLIFSTTYYYAVTCSDNLDNVVSVDEESFATLEEQVGTSEVDSTAPEISGVDAGSITGESATISWDTDEEANSLVRYGISSDEYENMAGNALVNYDTAEYVTSHEVIVNNLTPDTKYYYTVISIDASGNIGESSQESFSTDAASSLTSIKIQSQSLNKVTITWKSSAKTTSVVEYGLTEEYGDKKESSTKVTEHSVELSGLTSNSTYHFRVKGKDADNNWYSSGDYTLEPKSPPKISNLKVDEITEHGATVTFSTNVPTDALVTYTASDENKSGSQGKPDLSVTHSILLNNLESGTDFTLKVKVRDEDGNETESDPQTFRTGQDDSAPIIEQIKTDSALAISNKVQTIISWATNEATNATLIYKEGKNGEEKIVEVDKNYALYHIAVLTSFKPGTVYYFKVKSVDQAGNETVSEDYALLTPKQKENIVQVIVSNFEDIFGWAKLNK